MNKRATIIKRIDQYISAYLADTGAASIPEIENRLRDIHKFWDRPKVKTVLCHMIADNKVVREIRLTEGGAKRAVYRLVNTQHTATAPASEPSVTSE